MIYLVVFQQKKDGYNIENVQLNILAHCHEYTNKVKKRPSL